MLHESEARLLGDTAGARVLEIGCGSAPCTQWLQDRSALAIGVDISGEMLHRAHAPVAQADALALPFGDAAFDIVFSAFGAFPFLPDLRPAFTEAARVLTPGGRFVFSVSHPMRWIFDDDPEDLRVTHTYFERGYEERDESGRLTYAEYHHSFGDYVHALEGFRLIDVLEPRWPRDLTVTWGQWSPLRGAIFPGTAIFVCEKLTD